jgi:hypothetical protein
MPRQILDESRLHPAIRDTVANQHADIVHNVQAATLSNPVLVVGMAGNPFCRRARRMLADAGRTAATSANGGRAAHSRTGAAGRPSRWCS